MTTTTDLLRRAAKHAYAHARRLDAIGLDEKKSMVQQDAASLIALADDVSRLLQELPLPQYAQEIQFEGCGYILLAPEDYEAVHNLLTAMQEPKP